ncbi:MgtC family protein [compost metagenome]
MIFYFYLQGQYALGVELFLESLHPYLVGLLIGFVIGLERERAHEPESQALGVRTFTFVGLLGAIAGVIESDLISALIALFVGTAIIFGYLRSTRKSESSDIGLTTEVAGMVVFSLGYIGVTDRLSAFIMAALTLGLLVGRKVLHTFTRERITQAEAEAFVTLIVLGVAILPFLPKEPIDPWGVFVPFKLGTLVFLLALVQFASYALLKIFGEKVGAVLGGFLAGMASSTAAFVNIREQLNFSGKRFRGDLLAYGMMAILASTLQSVIIIFANSQELIRSLMWSFGLVFAVGIGLAVSGFFRLKGAEVVGGLSEGPLNLKKQLGFACILFFVMALVNLAKQFFGATAFLGISFLSGLLELQGVTFAISSIPFSEHVLWAMALAFIASLISKAFIISSASKSGASMKLVMLLGLGLLAVVFTIPLVLDLK